MLPRLSLLFLLVTPACLLGQTTLTFQYNSLREGDSNTSQEIQPMDPGAAGAKQTWDFSSVQYNSKSQCSFLQTAAHPTISGVGTYNFLLSENGYEYLMNSSEKMLEEIGYVNKDQKLSLFYSDPVVKMKYPFAYGDQFTDHFVGEAMFNESYKIDFYGDITVTADAAGTLILPDRVVNGVLRVKSVKKGLQVNMCGTTDVNIVKYGWYGQGYRYPLVSLNIVETSTNGNSPVLTTTAFTNTTQLQEKSGIVGAIQEISSIAGSTSEVKVTISPNPFTDQLNYSYYLPEERNVSVEVYDMSGKTYGWLVKNQMRPVGLHAGELKSSTLGLVSGVYFMRFSFDGQIVISKIVKL